MANCEKPTLIRTKIANKAKYMLSKLPVCLAIKNEYSLDYILPENLLVI
jgi:hypothetical protein